MDPLISPEELHEQMQSATPPTVVDVRSGEAYAEAHIPHAVHIPRDDLDKSLDRIPRAKPVVTY